MLLLNPYRFGTPSPGFKASPFASPDSPTPPNSPGAGGGGGSPSGDPFWKQVALLMHFDGDPNASSSSVYGKFIDDSSQKNYVYPYNALVTISNVQAKFGRTSLHCNTSRVRFFRTSKHYLGSGDFTIEHWMYYTGTAADRSFTMGDAASGGGNGKFTIGKAAASSVWYGQVSNAGGTTYQVYGPTDLAQNRWVHVALMRKGDNLYFCFDGIIYGPTALTAAMDIPATEPVICIGGIGLYASGGSGGAFGDRFLGYIDEFRWTKGRARYEPLPTSSPRSYNVPTAPFSNWSPLYGEPSKVISHDFEGGGAGSQVFDDKGLYGLTWTGSAGATISGTQPLEGYSRLNLAAATDYIEAAVSPGSMLPPTDEFWLKWRVRHTTFITSRYLMSVCDAGATPAGSQFRIWHEASAGYLIVDVSDGTKWWRVARSFNTVGGGSMYQMELQRKGREWRFWIGGQLQSVAFGPDTLNEPTGRKWRIGDPEVTGGDAVSPNLPVDEVQLIVVSQTSSPTFVGSPYNVSPRNDPYWAYVSLLVDGTWGEVVDLGPLQLPISPHPAARGEGTLLRFGPDGEDGTGSIFFEATGDGYEVLSGTYGAGYSPADDPFAMDKAGSPTGDYTVEFDVRADSVSNQDDWIDFRKAGASSPAQVLLYMTNGGKLAAYNGSTIYGGTGTALTASTWHRIAFVREAGTLSAYLNGTRQWQATVAGSFDVNSVCVIGNAQGFSNATGFRMRHIRITKGIARYSGATITQDTVPFPVE